MGARNKLSESVLTEVLADWEAHGAAAIKRVREEEPAAYLRLIASLVPKQRESRISDADGEPLVVRIVRHSDPNL